MKASGIKPGNGSSYFQNVRLIGLKADPSSMLQIGNDSYRFGDDFVATTGAQRADVSIDADLVFAGYGIDAPNYKWNDYGDDPNLYRGKVLMIMVNDPPATKAEPDLFGAKALTYYGRWTYKFEEAARRGAAGVILIHTDESAGYGWNVIRTSNGNWRYEVLRGGGEITPYLSLKSWVTNDAAKKILRSGRLDLDDLREKAKHRGFKPVATGLKVKLDLKSETKTSDSPNIVGVVEGSDSKLRNEYVVYTAHWDHLGIGEPDARGDRIYNGAYDNASGVATVLGIGEAFAKMPKKERPKRSLLFMFPTAEEQGLLGAEYYSLHPLVPLAKTVANVNIDGVNFFGKTSDFSALGAERSSIEAVIAEAARERNLTVEGDMRPEQGFFFRSDHFPFARVGVPSVSLRHGDKFVTPLKGEPEAFFKDYTAKYYHQASDEYKEWWDTSAMIQEAELAMAIGIKLANLSSMPRYKDSDEFSAADKMRFK
jgi:Zn-dependent M28 family amino/carboxypeptidase